MRLLKIVAALALMTGTLSVATPSASAVERGCKETSAGYTCIYGPFKLDRKMNVFTDLVDSIPEAGYITGARATLVDAQGDRVDHHMAHLHHAVWLNANKHDMTCPSYPDRFFATGKERTKTTLPEGYGYYWSNEVSQNFPQVGRNWVMNTHIDNMHGDVGHVMDVYIKLNLGFAPATESQLIDIQPAWFDIQNCTNDSEFTVPAGTGRFTTTWSYGLLQGGHFITMVGHLHDQGVKLILENDTQKTHIFTSRAKYELKSEPGYLTGMTTFSGLPGFHVDPSDSMKLTAIYKKGPKRVPDAMGIMFGAFVPDP
jgi:hypothetical protein